MSTAGSARWPIARLEAAADRVVRGVPSENDRSSSKLAAVFLAASMRCALSPPIGAFRGLRLRARDGVAVVHAAAGRHVMAPRRAVLAREPRPRRSGYLCSRESRARRRGVGEARCLLFAAVAAPWRYGERFDVCRGTRAQITVLDGIAARYALPIEVDKSTLRAGCRRHISPIDHRSGAKRDFRSPRRP